MVGGRINSTPFPIKHIVELLGLGPGPGPRHGIACLGGGGYSSSGGSPRNEVDGSPVLIPKLSQKLETSRSTEHFHKTMNSNKMQ